jgi:Ca2+-binding EF-hand superfamily protein
MQKLGMEVPMEEIKNIVESHDLTKDGMISFIEFKKIFEVQDQPGKAQSNLRE